MVLTPRKEQKLVSYARKCLIHTEDITFRHVSLIIRKGKIIASGINRTKTHPLASKYGYRYDAIHSELDALRRVDRKKRNGMTLVNFRFGLSGTLRMSKPCVKCMPWCIVTFDEIYYTDNTGALAKIETTNKQENEL